MRIMTFKRFMGAMVLVSVGVVLAACNTSKATIDTFAKFTSSTSPGEWLTADGLVKDHEKARLFAAVAFENLEQDIARGQGEYLSSLAVLLHIPARQQDEFRARAQRTYTLLVASDQRTAERLLAMLTTQAPLPD